MIFSEQFLIEIFRIMSQSSLSLLFNHKEYGYLDLGAILALTDEITTIVILCNDKTYRPGQRERGFFLLEIFSPFFVFLLLLGVSVQLSGELYSHEIRPGQNILIEACATKIGSTLAFTEVLFRVIFDSL